MNPSILAGTLCFAALGTGLASAQDGIPLEVTELAVKRKPSLPGAKSFGNVGLTLKVLALIKGKTIIGLDKEASVVKSWTDDQGTDLGAGAPTGFFHWVGLAHRFDSDTSNVHGLDLKTKTLPAKKATRMRLDAVIVLIAATGEEKVRGDITLEAGASVPNAPVPIKISESKAGFGGKWSVTFQSNAKMDGIKAVQFYDTNGQAVKTDKGSSSSSGFGDKYTYTRTFNLAKKLDAGKVELTLHKGIEKITIPLDLDLGLGL